MASTFQAAITTAPQFITEWRQRAGNVSLFHEGDALAFSTQGRNGPTTRFAPSPYSVNYAVNLTLMFRKTIGEILKQGEPSSASFIPLLFADGGIGPKAHIALYGRVSPPSEENQDSLKGLKWGIFYPSTGGEQFLDVDDPCSKDYVRLAPQVLSPDDETYQERLAEYAKRFSVDFERDESGHIQRITLKYQRSWYESAGRSCPKALMDYLAECEPASLQTLRQLGLAPEQISQQCTDVEWAYFRTMIEQLKSQPKAQQNSIFANLERQYPTIFPILFQELLHCHEQEPSDSEYMSLLEILRRGVVGQDRAAERLAAALNSQTRTSGNAVFLFVGPSGVGKTELAKVASTIKRNRFVKFDMDQFKGQSDFSKLFGSAAGLVGSTDQPLFAKELEKYASPLTERGASVLVRTVKDVIVVFDELEKAHFEVKQSLLTLFDEAYCKVQYTDDRRNRLVQYVFEKCIFVGTSNLYKDLIIRDFQRGIAPDTIALNFVEWNKTIPTPQSYSSELIGRMSPIAFSPIPRGEVYQNLIQSKLSTFLEALQTAVNCPSIEIANNDLPAVLGLLEEKLYGDGTGIRKVKRYFDEEVKTAIYKQSGWGDLSDKLITITSSSGRLSLKCVKAIFGKVVHEYPVVSI